MSEAQEQDPFADIIPLKMDVAISDKTREIIMSADKKRKTRGQFGGLSLGSKRFHMLNQNWGGIDVGVHIVGGDTNLGKSSLLRMFAWDIVQNNPDVHVRFYTLDDSEDYFFSCMVAQAADIPINSVHKPEAFINKAATSIYSQEDYEFMVDRGHKTFESFLQPHVLERFSFTGTDNLEDASWNTIKKDIAETKALIGDRQLVVVIDNLHDIELPGFTDTNDRTEAVAKEVDKAAKEMELIIIGSVELKKNQQRRPIIDDIYGSRKWKYKARTILLLYSEVGAGKPHPRLYFERRDKPGELCSVLEIHFAKSKVSEFKGRLFMEQFTERGTGREVIGESAAHYASQIS